MADVVTREGLLARVQHLAPVIRAHADCNFTRQAAVILALGHFVWCSPTGSDNISPYNVMVFREVTT